MVCAVCAALCARGVCCAWSLCVRARVCACVRVRVCVHSAPMRHAATIGAGDAAEWLTEAWDSDAQLVGVGATNRVPAAFTTDAPVDSAAAVASRASSGMTTPPRKRGTEAVPAAAHGTSTRQPPALSLGAAAVAAPSSAPGGSFPRLLAAGQAGDADAVRAANAAAAAAIIRGWGGASSQPSIVPGPVSTLAARKLLVSTSVDPFSAADHRVGSSGVVGPAEARTAEGGLGGQRLTSIKGGGVDTTRALTRPTSTTHVGKGAYAVAAREAGFGVGGKRSLGAAAAAAMASAGGHGGHRDVDGDAIKARPGDRRGGGGASGGGGGESFTPSGSDRRGAGMAAPMGTPGPKPTARQPLTRDAMMPPPPPVLKQHPVAATGTAAAPPMVTATRGFARPSALARREPSVAPSCGDWLEDDHFKFDIL